MFIGQIPLISQIHGLPKSTFHCLNPWISFFLPCFFLHIRINQWISIVISYNYHSHSSTIIMVLPCFFPRFEPWTRCHGVHPGGLWMECRGGGRPTGPDGGHFLGKKHGKSVGLIDFLMDCLIDSGKLICFIDFLIDWIMKIMIVEEWFSDRFVWFWSRFCWDSID